MPPELKDHDFHALSRKEKHSRTRIRWLGMAHLQEGREYHEVAKFLYVSEETVQKWVKRFKAFGLEGLKESPRSGAKRKLEGSQEFDFKKAVIDLQENRSGGRITGHDIQILLEEQFQVKCCLNSAYNLLSRLDLVWITVRSKHPQQSQEKQDAFKKTFETRP
ncbi:helix-turn-helix domain-containing protein [Methylobacter svalbardensis]|uniref:helix-turn-helix domain-containing protein n=1 Tax=Methylobacter svalbardensis TaxID=3080016 RepID=UPI0030EC8326